MTPSIDLFIFSDALGWELARERNVLTDLLPHRASCETIFGYSSSCDPSILTGKVPSEHGHFSFFVYDPKNSPFRSARWFSWAPPLLFDHHRVRNQISKYWGRRLGFTGYFQLYSAPFSKLPLLDYTERRDIYLPGGITGGQEVIFSRWEKLGIPWYRSDWRAGDAANIASMKEKLREGKIRCAYLFTGALDAVMHANGTLGSKVDQAFAQFETWIRELHSIAIEKYQEVRLHLFSDHGMTDTTATSDMMRRFETLGLQYARDYAAVWDSTMARFWFLKPGVRDKVETWLRQQPEGRVLQDEELRKWGCLFADRRYGEIFYLLNPGTIFVPCFMSAKRVTAMHGFSPDEPTSKACWLTSHPTETPRRIEEIFDVMLSAAKRLLDCRMSRTGGL